ncbi:hypothetical protein L3X38_012960 [Prunus dulcis]|uniref:Uncharacterized protein n=1 Tax=Prunus dulcis TaxID=3755 RepID=A0AAD4ZH46_PRUDU|nr:hypothetical protein L3X38_012960 [Prunus dulcis]
MELGSDQVGKLSKMQATGFNVVVPFQKYGRALPFAKVVGHILTKVVECFLLKKLGWELLKYLGRPLLLQTAGLGRIFSLRTLVPSSQHLGKQSLAKGVEVRWEVSPLRELKFSGRYVRRVPNIRIFENSKIVHHMAKPNIQIFGVLIPLILADGRRMVSQI